MPATTPGPTTSTARCERAALRARARVRPPTTGRCCPRASAPGARSCSSTPTRLQCRSPNTSASCRRSSRARSTSTVSSSTHASSSAPNANWKIVVENFLECYHCPTAHPGFSAEVDVHPDRYLLEAHPTFAAQFAQAKKTGERGPVPSAVPEHGPQRLPRPGEPLDRADRAGRRRPDRALPRLLLRPGRSTTTGSASSSRSTTRSVGRTRALVESVHRGMASGMLEHGRLLLNAEPLLAAFQRWVGTQLGSRVESTRTPRQPTGGTL